MPHPSFAPQPPKAHTWAGVLGWLFMVFTLIVAALSINFWIDDERKWDEEHAAYDKEYAAWEADSASRNAEVARLEARQAQAEARGDTAAVIAYTDSITIAEAEPAPARLGFPLGGMVSIFILLLDLIPLFIGIVLLVFYYTRRAKRREWYYFNGRMNR